MDGHRRPFLASTVDATVRHLLIVENPLAPIIRVENVHFNYNAGTEHPVPALQGVDLTVREGEYLVIVGHNGSGKSTLARHLNGLLLPHEGDVWVEAFNTKDLARAREIRSTVGMVFQTPDNQIVATIVEEDVAFGPENLALPHEEIVSRVDWALEQVGMDAFRNRAPHLLSGGQKQRICIAGVLAMRPRVLVLDESTAMLDPLGRQELLDIVTRLNKEEGVTVVAITHYMEEAVAADRLIVMSEGIIALEGTPRQIFAMPEKLRKLHIDLPQIARLAEAMNKRDDQFPKEILTVGEFVEAVAARAPSKNGTVRMPPPAPAPQPSSSSELVIKAESIGYFHMRATPLEVKAISDISLEVRRGEIMGFIGHTGSGKSTIIQHFNALFRPHEGRILIFGQDSNEPKLDAMSIRRRIGFVFQQSEAQLFEHYVGDDVAYGPRNLKLPREEVRERVRRAMEAVGLGFEAFKDRITFGLSGGEMRRAAVAGVLALEPEALVLDEPTAGLDPQGRDQLLESFLRLHREEGITLILVSHNMEEMARICHRICVIHEGRVEMIGTPTEVFGKPDRLRQIGLGVPAVTDAVDQLARRGLVKPHAPPLNVEQAANIVEQVLNERV
jgi:energy-coupling factor transport system ATP-binding protein